VNNSSGINLSEAKDKFVINKKEIIKNIFFIRL